jgi:formylglycine-generating enzyme
VESLKKPVDNISTRRRERALRTTSWLVAGIGAWVGLSASLSLGQDVVISSIQGSGRLSWTNAVNTNGLCRVEWGSSVTGPWHRTFQAIQSIDTLTNTAFTVTVPIFYRVAMATNPPPDGMMWIDGGDVELGQKGIAEPVHTNYISGFWMDETEVTFGKWKEVYNWALTNGYTFDNAGSGNTNNHPVHTVNWYDCVKWCNARSQKEGCTPCYYLDPGYSGVYRTGDLNVSNSWVKWSANGYRLPTEAEWEKAARGGRRQRFFPWGGDTIQHARANYYAATNSWPYDTSPTQGYHPDFQMGDVYTSPVGCFPGNGFGLNDMAGNVWEWCWDWNATYAAAYTNDPRGAGTGTHRTSRGGSWLNVAFGTRCADRFSDYPGSEYSDVGFRCARGP